MAIRLKYILPILLVSVSALAGVFLDKLNVDNLQLDGNTLSTTNTNGDLTISLNGTGSTIFSNLTASTVPYLDASKKLKSSAVTNTELGYLSGVTSSIQTQLNGKASTISAGNLTAAGTDGIAVTGGTGAVLSSASLAQHVADSTHNGYLTSTDWSTFNGKGAGTVTTASVVNTNGFNGSVANATTTPAITISTTISGMLKGNATAISAATAGTDYSAGTNALGTGILKSTTGTGALTIAVAGDFPTLNQNTSGSAASLSATLGVASGGTGQTSYADGQLLIGNSSGNTLTKATLTAGSNVTITNGNGSIVIASTGGATPAFAIGAKTATYNVTTSDNILFFSGGTPGNIVLPTAVGNTNYYKFCKTDASYANVWPITTTSSQTISGFASGAIQLASFMDCYELFSDNSNWQISSHTYGEGVTDGGAITVGAVTTPPTLNGTITLNKYSYSRHGHFIHVQYRFNQTTASTGGSGIYKFPLPTGITADVTATGIAAYTGATNASGAGNSYVGSGMVYASTTAINGEIYAELYDTTNLAFQIFSVSGTNFGMFGSAVVGFNNAILSFTVDADVPVSSFTP